MHRSVLLAEVLSRLALREDGVYVDATLGGGGHAEAILDRLGPAGRLIGLDADPAAVMRARERLARFGGRFQAAQSRFSRIAEVAAAAGAASADGALMDLGVSSFQLDEAARGFSFQQDGPLDMRMDDGAPLTAAAVVNEWPETELERIFRAYGEEPQARRLARRIAARRAERPFSRTLELADFVAAETGGRRGRIHPATKVFQALRMAVNDELGELERGLDAALRLLRPGGRLAVIAFHSLEDRRVKQFFRAHAGRWESLQAGGARWAGEAPPVRLLTRKAVTPTAAECAENPRARSARLRVAERLEAAEPESEI